jgi:Fic family protein
MRSEYESLFKASRRQAIRDLNDLCEKGLVEAIGNTNRRHYRTRAK